MEKTTILTCLLLICTVCIAQEQITPKTEKVEKGVNLLQKLKVSGYIQTQFQYGEKDASLKTGSSNESDEKSFNRIGIRRGRIKFAYEEGIASGVFQLDITEKGVGLKDAYLNLKDPWSGTSAFRAGVFDRPFGYEIAYSSSQRESPERSMVFQTLFPDERDLGGMLVLQAARESSWNFLKLQAGVFAGNGIKQETDSRKDFIGHLSANKNIGDKFKLNGGISYYNGGVYQGTENVYSMQDNSFVLNNDPSNKGKFAKREYLGFYGELDMNTSLGMTKLRTEYLLGTQPGVKSDSKSPNASILPAVDTYIRNFEGGYLMMVQELGTLPLSAVIKYDWYDPNTKVYKNQLGQNGTGKGDIAYNTLGFGVLWQANKNIRLQAYYELVDNEKSENLTGYDKKLKKNIFTLRLQYKF